MKASGKQAKMIVRLERHTKGIWVYAELEGVIGPSAFFPYNDTAEQDAQQWVREQRRYE